MALNKEQSRRLQIAAGWVVALLIADQAFKVWIKTHLQLGESIRIFSWFKLSFTENAGMAFGMEIMETYLLTIMRIVIVCVFGWYIVKLIRRDFKFGYVICLSLILAGALGNIIDSAFYGVLFDDSYGHVASFMPEGGGYSTFLQGKVVDMLYFPLITTAWPAWVPVWGGQEFIFFRPIFNLADSAICVSAFILLLFYRPSLLKSFAREDVADDNR